MTEPKVKHLKVATKSESKFLDEIAQLVQNARNAANSAVSSIIVVTNWNIGRRIVEQEQKSKLNTTPLFPPKTQHEHNIPWR